MTIEFVHFGTEETITVFAGDHVPPDNIVVKLTLDGKQTTWGVMHSTWEYRPYVGHADITYGALRVRVFLNPQ